MSETRHTVDPKFVFNRQGKDMVLYAGLVDAAQRAGILGIETSVLQFPHPDNGQTVIVKAVATFPLDWVESPETGNPIAVGARQFSGIGDANPQNVGKNIAPHFIRMAETRAKARALRDALNVGMVTVEELGGDDDGNAAAQPRPAQPVRPATPRQNTRTSEDEGFPYVKGAEGVGPSREAFARPTTPRQMPQDAPEAPAAPIPPEPLTDAQERTVAEARDMAEARDTLGAVDALLRSLKPATTPGQWKTISARRAKLVAEFYPESVLTGGK